MNLEKGLLKDRAEYTFNAVYGNALGNQVSGSITIYVTSSPNIEIDGGIEQELDYSERNIILARVLPLCEEVPDYTLIPDWTQTDGPSIGISNMINP